MWLQFPPLLMLQMTCCPVNLLTCRRGEKCEKCEKCTEHESQLCLKAPSTASNDTYAWITRKSSRWRQTQFLIPGGCGCFLMSSYSTIAASYQLQEVCDKYESPQPQSNGSFQNPSMRLLEECDAGAPGPLSEFSEWLESLLVASDPPKPWEMLRPTPI
ncbi:hypothetical protein BJ875DRAFT_200596 [Amylocarpus encephaloides]|uniref:Uncharacterized protein n=1 Tax=Amylocarpus encephaloides TaxID=45428 RepID=A0A9P8C0X8_9HELO|nr:hypothetical protein BJ875DRAFT_200596 [Amylocarpus encephaloides]